MTQGAAGGMNQPVITSEKHNLIAGNGSGLTLTEEKAKSATLIVRGQMGRTREETIWFPNLSLENQAVHNYYHLEKTKPKEHSIQVTRLLKIISNKNVVKLI
jgi:hypothetical protein